MAIVEDFFDIIYGVHVEMDGRGGKHAGQKRTYRAVSQKICLGVKNIRNSVITEHALNLTIKPVTNHTSDLVCRDSS